jgi:hypothetical protein
MGRNCSRNSGHEQTVRAMIFSISGGSYELRVTIFIIPHSLKAVFRYRSFRMGLGSLPDWKLETTTSYSGYHFCSIFLRLITFCWPHFETGLGIETDMLAYILGTNILGNFFLMFRWAPKTYHSSFWDINFSDSLDYE